MAVMIKGRVTLGLKGAVREGSRLGPISNLQGLWSPYCKARGRSDQRARSRMAQPLAVDLRPMGRELEALLSRENRVGGTGTEE